MVYNISNSALPRLLDTDQESQHNQPSRRRETDIFFFFSFLSALNMDTTHRKIELQSPADLNFLKANATRAAREKIDLHFPPSAAPTTGDDAMKKRVEELVDQVCIANPQLAKRLEATVPLASSHPASKQFHTSTSTISTFYRKQALTQTPSPSILKKPFRSSTPQSPSTASKTKKCTPPSPQPLLRARS